MTRSARNSSAVNIGELANILETTTKTLRHYEKKGLINPSYRNSSGYRIYDAADQRRVRQIMGLRRLGLSIPEIQDLLKNGSQTPSVRSRLLGLLDEKIRNIDENLAILQGRRDDLSARYLTLYNTPAGRNADCICNVLLRPCDCDARLLNQSDAKADHNSAKSR